MGRILEAGGEDIEALLKLMATLGALRMTEGETSQAPRQARLQTFLISSDFSFRRYLRYKQANSFANSLAGRYISVVGATQEKCQTADTKSGSGYKPFVTVEVNCE